MVRYVKQGSVSAQLWAHRLFHMKILSKIILVAVSALAACSAFAEDLKFAGMANSSPLKVSISLNGGDFKNTYAGILKMTDGSQTINSYCANVFSPLNTSYHSYTASNVDFNGGTNLSMAGRIVANSYFDADTASEQAALQLAIWSALHNGGSSFNANGSAVKFSGVSSDVLSLASQYFQKGFLDPVNSATFYGSSEAGAQSQITASPVPEPFTLGFLGAAGLAAFLRRRRMNS